MNDKSLSQIAADVDQANQLHNIREQIKAEVEGLPPSSPFRADTAIVARCPRCWAEEVGAVGGRFACGSRPKTMYCPFEQSHFCARVTKLSYALKSAADALHAAFENSLHTAGGASEETKELKAASTAARKALVEYRK